MRDYSALHLHINSSNGTFSLLFRISITVVKSSFMFTY